MPANRTTQLDLTPAQRRCVDTLDEHKGNRTAAADALGMDQRSFRRRLAEAVERGAELPEPADAAPVRKPRRIEVKLDDLVLSRDLQPRVGIDGDAVSEYAVLYRDRGPTAMDPIRAYAGEDGRPILTRGFTRVTAARVAGLDTLPCDLYAEADDEAMLRDSLSGNRHGLRLSNADKRRALKLYHERIARRRWDSTREVAVLLGCSHELVSSFRKELTAPKPATPPAAKPAPEGGKGAQPEAKPTQPPAPAAPPAAEPLPQMNSSGLLEVEGPEDVDLFTDDGDLTVEAVVARLNLAIAGSGLSAAAYARKYDLPYLALSKLLATGITPGDDTTYGPIYDHALTLDASAPPPKASPEVPPATAKPAAEPPAKPDPKPRTLAERRLERERELVCQRILEQPGNIAPGCHRELALLLLIVGIDSDPTAVWNDDELSDAEARWDAAIASRVTVEIRAGHPRLPDLATIARLWQIDADAIRIQAQRAVPS
jgi:transposase-like protein